MSHLCIEVMHEEDFVIVCFELRQSFIMQPSVAKNILDRQGWPGSLRESLAFASEVLL